MVGVFERVFEVGPVFRAEPHDTARHLAQYTSLDAEMGFIDDHRDVMAVLTTVARRDDRRRSRRARASPVAGGAGRDPGGALRRGAADRRARRPTSPTWPRRTSGRWASGRVREHGSEFVFVTGYPMRETAVLHPPATRPTRPGRNSFDLLFRGLELVTGGQRLHRYEDYLAALAARGEPLEPYAGYLDGFRYGMPPHGGFAIGLERFVARLTGAANVREVTAFPRDLHRVTP